MMEATELGERVLAGDRRALGRAISHIEDRRPGYRELAATFQHASTGAHVIGLTGAPGAGKSTLLDGLIGQYRERDRRVGVIAVDPTSPFSGGSILGDRVRIPRVSGDDGVFVRSMSTRGTLGGVSPATTDVIAAYDAFGMDRIIVETVGAGQNEVDIVRTADTVCVVVQPESGDDVQMLKAGILEIGDLFVVNKVDLPGADGTIRRLQELVAPDRVTETWNPPVLDTIATQGEGISTMYEMIEAHLAWLVESDSLQVRRRDRHRAHLLRIVRDDVATLVEQHGGLDEFVDRIIAGDTDVYQAADDFVDSILSTDLH